MFFKKKPVVFKFYTCNKDAFTLAKPDKAVKFFPKWWRELARNFNEENKPDMTHCAGFLDMYKKSIIVPAWSDFEMVVAYDFYNWSYVDGKSIAVEHTPNQRGSFLPEERYQHIKLISPWFMECDEDISVSWQEPTYSNEIEGMKVLPGIIVPSQMNEVNINLIFERTKDEKKYLITWGMPLIQMLPLTEREFKIEHYLITQDEFTGRVKPRVQTKHMQHMKTIKKLEKQSKCPFGGAK